MVMVLRMMMMVPTHHWKDQVVKVVHCPLKCCTWLGSQSLHDIAASRSLPIREDSPSSAPGIFESLISGSHHSLCESCEGFRNTMVTTKSDFQIWVEPDDPGICPGFYMSTPTSHSWWYDDLTIFLGIAENYYAHTRHVHPLSKQLLTLGAADESDEWKVECDKLRKWSEDGHSTTAFIHVHLNECDLILNVADDLAQSCDTVCTHGPIGTFWSTLKG